MRTWWIEGVTPGGLAVIERPRGGDWLEDDLRALAVQGVTHVVSAQPLHEASTHGLSGEGEACAALGLGFVRLAIEDMTAPAPDAFTDELAALSIALSEGARIGVHCRAGMGRSPMLVAALLVQGGLSAGAAWERIASARGLPVPETDAQRTWVANLAVIPQRPE